MKLILLCFFFSINIYSQYEYIKTEDLMMIDSVQKILKNDSIAYKHFLFTKKCLCLDKMENNKKISNDVIKWMNHLGYPIFVLFDVEKFKKTINTNLTNEIDYKKQQLGKRDEKFYSTANKFIICESIASNSTKNKDQFFHLLKDINIFDKYKYEYNLRLFLSNINYNNAYWGN